MRSDYRRSEGAALLEVLLAVLLMGIGMLAVAPMFLTASNGNATNGDRNIVGATGVERMKLLREEDPEDPIFGVSWRLTDAGFGMASFQEAADSKGDTVYCTDDLNASNPVYTFEMTSLKQN